MFQILLSCIPLLAIICLMFFFKIKEKGDFKFFINSFFWAYMTVLLVAVITSILTVVFPTLASSGGIIKTFGYCLIFAGFTEEISKFICLKLSKPKSDKMIILNALLISTFFSIVEHYSFLGAVLSNDTIIGRLITPGHVLYLLFPAWFMIIGKKFKHTRIMTFIGLIIGMLVHTLYDFMDKNIIINAIFCVIGYAAIIFSLYKVSKMSNKEQEKEQDINQENVRKFFIIKLVIVILFSLFFIFAFNKGNNLKPLNSYYHDSEENVDVMVTSIEEVDVTSLLGESNHYIKVGVAIKNTSASNYLFNDSNFCIINKEDGSFKLPNILLETTDSIVNGELKPGEERKGYVYYKVEGTPNDYRIRFRKMISNSNGIIFGVD